MAKANFSKVEKALEEGIVKMTSERLCKETGKEALEKAPSRDAVVLTLDRIFHDLSLLSKKDPSLLDKLKVTKNTLNAFYEKASTLTPAEWKTVKEIQVKIEQQKKSAAPSVTDDDLIASERKKHINKRFNVREKWLPLQ